MGVFAKLRAGAAFARFFFRLPWGYKCFLLRRMKYTKRKRHNGRVHINTFYPPYPSKAFDRFCDHVVHARRVPQSAYVAITARCPCKCPHCSYAHREIRDVPREGMLDAVRQVRELGTPTIAFTGGEPLLRNDLADLIASVADDTAVGIFTTGHGLSAERARELAGAGVTWVTVGLESPHPQQHDAVRGAKGSFEAGRKAIEACRQAGIFTAISTIGFAEKIDAGDLERMYQMGKEWGVGEFRIIPPVATGGIAGSVTRMLNAEQMQALYDFHLEHNRRKDGGPTVACFAYLESADMFGCGAGYHHMFVDAAGEVCPCDLTPLSFGNLHQRPLAEIWDEMGRHFPRPRCGCLMASIGRSIPADAPLPLPPERARCLVTSSPLSMPLPAGYRAILKHRSENGAARPQDERAAPTVPAANRHQ